jgi:hypothetical protein
MRAGFLFKLEKMEEHCLWKIGISKMEKEKNM